MLITRNCSGSVNRKHYLFGIDSSFHRFYVLHTEILWVYNTCLQQLTSFVVIQLKLVKTAYTAPEN